MICSYNLFREQFSHSMAIFNSFLKLSTGSNIDIPFKRTNCLPQIPSLSVCQTFTKWLSTFLVLQLMWSYVDLVFIQCMFFHVMFMLVSLIFVTPLHIFACMKFKTLHSFYSAERANVEIRGICTDALHKTFPVFEPATYQIK